MSATTEGHPEGTTPGPAEGHPVRISQASGVTTITLARPEAMNSLDIATKVALREAVRAASADPDVRCVVLTGTGRAFCVGQDLKEHVEILAGPDTSRLFTTVPEHYNPTVAAIASMPKPVIASLNGVAAGAGASLALACDFRVMSESAGLNFAFAGIGLSCDTGASWTLPRFVGTAKAIELLYQPRTIKAAECLELGLVTQVVADDDLAEATRDLAARLSAGPTVAYGAIRASVAHSATHSLEESLAFEAEMMARTGRTEDHGNAVSAFIAKQAPTFRGR